MALCDNSYWRAGFCRGFEKAELPNSHSVAFLDGYDYGLRIRELLDERDSIDIPDPLNSRSNDVRGILEENRQLKREIKILSARLGDKNR